VEKILLTFSKGVGSPSLCLLPVNRAADCEFSGLRGSFLSERSQRRARFFLDCGARADVKGAVRFAFEVFAGFCGAGAAACAICVACAICANFTTFSTVTGTTFQDVVVVDAASWCFMDKATVKVVGECSFPICQLSSMFPLC